jgi:hypothetical protein
MAGVTPKTIIAINIFRSVPKSTKKTTRAPVGVTFEKKVIGQLKKASTLAKQPMSNPTKTPIATERTIERLNRQPVIRESETNQLFIRVFVSIVPSGVKVLSILGEKMLTKPSLNSFKVGMVVLSGFLLY